MVKRASLLDLIELSFKRHHVVLRALAFSRTNCSHDFVVKVTITLIMCLISLVHHVCELLSDLGENVRSRLFDFVVELHEQVQQLLVVVRLKAFSLLFEPSDLIVKIIDVVVDSLAKGLRLLLDPLL